MPVDEILGRRRAGHAAPLRRAGAARDAGSLHQHRDRAVPDPDAAAEHQLGVHSLRAVGCRTRPRGSRGSDRSATRAGPLAPTAAGTARRRSRPRDAQHAAGDLDRQALAGDHRDRLEPPFGRTASFSISAARRCTASSVSSSRIRRRAAASSSRSLAQPRQLTTVDLLLPPPAVDRLIADLEQPRHLRDRLAGRDQIQRPPAELRRIPLRPSRPPDHLVGRPSLETGPHGTGATALSRSRAGADGFVVAVLSPCDRQRNTRPSSDQSQVSFVEFVSSLGVLGERTAACMVCGITRLVFDGVGALHTSSRADCWSRSRSLCPLLAVLHLTTSL